MCEAAKRLKFKECMLDTSLFRKVYLITLSFEMLAFLDILSLAVKCIVLSWGLFILIHNFFIEKRAFKVKYKYLLWSFLVCMTVTSVIHMSMWFVPNIALVYYTAVCFFMFYGMYTENSPEEIEKEMVFILKFFIYFGTICAAFSLLTLFWKREFSAYGYYLGIFKNRLIGIYTNSNILAFSMIESIVACDIISDSYVKRKFKNAQISNWILILCVFLNCICLFLSDSNASFLFLIIYSTIRVFCNVFFKSQSSYGIKFLKSILIVLGFCGIIMSAMFALRGVCQNFIGIAVNDMYKQKETVGHSPKNSYAKALINKNLENENSNIRNISFETTVENSDEIPNEEYVPDLHIGREHYEVSSGRITLFKQGIEMFKHNPIFGISRANLTMYSKKYLKGGLIHPDLHNGYLTILVSYGIIGLLIFSIFSFVVALDICKNMFLCVNCNYFCVFSKLFSALVAYCGYCLFEKAILFDMTFMVGFFWAILGFAVSYVYGLKAEN